MKYGFRTIQKTFFKYLNWFKSISLKKKIFIVVVGLIVLIVTISQIRQAFAPPPYTLQKVSIGDITETVKETGTITAGSADVYSPTTGFITKVYVSNGEDVAEGTSLFSVESSATPQEQQAAYSNYLTAKESLNSANSSADTLRAAMYGKWKTFLDIATNSTYENGDKSPNQENRKAAEFQIAQDNWHAAEKAYNDQKTAIDQSQALVNSTWLLYQATQNSEVKAPIAGIISNLTVDEGSSVKANSITAPQKPVLIVAKDKKREVIVGLSQADAVKVQPGQKATIDVSAVTSKRYSGEVARIDEFGTNTQGVITYNVYIRILDSDQNLKPGMTVDAEIETKKLTKVLSVPNSAVKPYQGGKAVRVPGTKKGQVKYILVTIGIRGKEKTQILRGLSANQEVITTMANEQIKRAGLFGN